MRSAAENGDFLKRIGHEAEAKVDDFNILCDRVDQNVVEFDVTVGIALFMHERDTLDQLLENVLTGVFGQTLIFRLLDRMVETRTRA